MAQSLDASVSSLMYVRLVAKSVSHTELHFLSFFITILNSSAGTVSKLVVHLASLQNYCCVYQIVYNILVLFLLDSQI